jgi:ABC-type Fe3+ transport system permease subunit
VSTYDPPHLWPRDKRNPFGRLDADLRDIANSNPNGAYGVPSEDAYLSWDARKRRQYWYYFMCALCIFPFIAPLVYMGKFNSALSWYTKGETDRLNRKQRHNVMILGTVISALWLCITAVVVTLLATRGNNGHF